jgi:methyl-accepting chemotaxis protein
MRTAFSRLSIRIKLLAGFGLVLLTMVGLCLFAVQRMSLMDEASSRIRNSDLPKMTAIGELATVVQKFRMAESRHIMSTNAEEMNAEEKKIADLAAAYAAARKSYDAMIEPGDQALRLRTIDALWSRYGELDGQLIEASSKIVSGGAAELYKGEMQSVFDGMANLLDQDIAYDRKTGSSDAEQSGALFRSTRAITLFAAGIAALATVLIGVALVRGISVPLARMTAAMRRLAERDTTAEIPGTGRGDEIGAMADAVQVFKESIETADRLAAEQDRERAAKEARALQLTELVAHFEAQVSGMVGQLSSAAGELEQTAQSMSSTARQTEGQAAAVASAAGQASSGVQTVAAAAEELAASVSEITRQMTESVAMTGEAADEARRTDAIVGTLSEGATRIGNVVSLISGIAGQTNLLALNATIEAARAGDAGKGFAVVASEVKSLAGQTAKATSEIGAQIAHLQAAVNEAVGAIRGIVGRIERISVISTAIASAVEQQGAATAEIARNVQQTASATEDVSASISGVSQAANDTGAAAAQVLGASRGLSRQAEELTGKVASFVAGVRSA